MWKKRLLGALALYLLLSSGLWSEVVLTDEQAQELDQTLTELETVLQEQKKTLDEQQTVISEQQITIEQQQGKMSELNNLLEEQEKSSLMHDILKVTISVLVGLLIGLMF